MKPPILLSFPTASGSPLHRGFPEDASFGQCRYLEAHLSHWSKAAIISSLPFPRTADFWRTYISIWDRDRCGFALWSRARTGGSPAVPATTTIRLGSGIHAGWCSQVTAAGAMDCQHSIE